MVRVKVMASLIWNLLRRTALPRNTTCSTSFGVIASNLVCRLVSSVEFDSNDKILISFFFQEMSEAQHRVLGDSTQDISWKKKKHQNSVTGIKFYTIDKPTD